ncbi:MAG: hypothetical protein WDN75_14490 [Bacteroidota bacterium]
MNKSFLLPFVFCIVQCTSSVKKEEPAVSDSLSVPFDSSSTISAASAHETSIPDPNAIDIEKFIQEPFESDYEALQKIMKEDGFLLRVDSSQEFKPLLFQESTYYSSNPMTLQFDSSLVTMMGKIHQEATGVDVICSADITSSKFRFSQGVTIGMSKSDFLKHANLPDSLVTQDASTGKSYFEKEAAYAVPFTNAFYRMKIWFTDDTLTRFQYETFPCVIDTFE